MKRRTPDHDAPTDAPATSSPARPARELAPIEPDPDAEPIEHVEPAAVYPTEADELAAIAQVLENDPTLAHSTPHTRARAIAAQLAANGSRAARRRSAVAVALVEHAPLFPTEAHYIDLRDAIPMISDDEVSAVFQAGYASFLASLDAHEPVLDPEE